MSAKLTTLTNGLRVVSDSMASVESASVGVWVDAGARHEKPNVNGVSHVLEHMAFKGTARRSARDIAEEIEAVGGHINAYTSREHTAYYAKVLKEDVGLAVDIIADILQNSAFDPEELAREREVIIQEINHADETPDDIIFDRFQETAFLDQPLGQSVLGTVERVRSLERDSIVGYMKQHYSAKRMVVAGAGAVDHDRLVTMAEEAFAGFPQECARDDDAARFIGGEWREERDLEQVHMVLGFDGISYEDPDFYAASVFSTLFGGGMSSRLFQEVREVRGLAYSVYSFLSCYCDSGILGIYAATGHEEAKSLTPLLCEEIAKVRETVGEDEVARARAQLKASILMSLESTSARCEQLARQLMIFGQPMPASEVIDAIEAVDGAAIKRVAGRLTAGKPAFATLGPMASVETLEKIEARLA